MKIAAAALAPFAASLTPDGATTSGERGCTVVGGGLGAGLLVAGAAEVEELPGPTRSRGRNVAVKLETFTLNDEATESVKDSTGEWLCD